MKNLKQLSSRQLVQDLQVLVQQERDTGAQILEFLGEVQRRKIYAEFGYSSLFLFCVQALHYSEADAFRKVQAVRVVNEIPEVEASVRSGALTLSTVAQVQSFCKAHEKETGEKVSTQEKKAILASAENKSRREVEVILAIRAAEAGRESPLPPESEKRVSPNHTQVLFVADDELLGDLKRLKELMAATIPDASMAEVVRFAVNIALDKKDPERKMERMRLKKERDQRVGETEGKGEKASTVGGGEKGKSALDGKSEVGISELPPGKSSARRAIPQAVFREVYQRDVGRCTYFHPETGKRCGETRRLELDHCEPHAVGGENTVENLKSTCRSHNLYIAERYYGRQKIQGHIRTGRGEEVGARV